jgi:hypothetical protein
MALKNSSGDSSCAATLAARNWNLRCGPFFLGGLMTGWLWSLSVFFGNHGLIRP